jgi:hypothetical protein
MAPSSIRATAAALLALLVAPRTAHADANAMEAAKREHLDAEGDAPIASIRVEGLRRTRPAVVEQWIDCKVGEPLSRCDLGEIYERLYRLAIFSDIDVALARGPKGVDVVIRVKEKWTLYPVPMLWYSPRTQLAGLLLVEANLLGYNKGLAIGGVYTNRGWYTLAGYNDPNIGFTDAWATLHGFLGSGLVENDARDATVEQSFDMTRFDLEGALGWTFWDRLSPAWTSVLRVARVGATHVEGAEPAHDGTVAIQGFYLVWSDRRYRELYDEGMRLSAEVQHAFPLDRATPAYDDVSFDGKWAYPAPLGGFVDVRAHAFTGPLPIVFEERLGGLPGSRTLPGSGLVAADRYGSLSVEYQVPFWTLSVGTASALVFGEVGRYARNAEPAVTYGGPGAGLRFYLKHVAIPAVGVDVGYETGSRLVQFSVSIGYRPVR